jgi:hypothetical protein
MTNVLCTASSQFRHFLTSQQSAGSSSASGAGASHRGGRAAEKKALFINCENSFRDFVFERNGESTDEFEPRITSGRVAALPGSDEDAAGTSDLYLRLDMTSSLDGDGIGQAE